MGASGLNAVAPEFQGLLDTVRANYFSRDPKVWPIFAESSFAQINAFRRLNLAPNERLKQYPKGEVLAQQLADEHHAPQKGSVPDEGPSEMLKFAAALSKDWENPSSVENVVVMPCDPAVYGSMMGVLANPNLVYKEYAEMATELESAIVRQVANLAGYDAENATGIFTQGGTMCNLYGYLLGIRKSLPKAKHYGMEGGKDYRILNSQAGHYSNTTNLSLLGVNIREKTIRIRMGRNNDIDVDDLEFQLEACFRLKCVVPTIMLTMGTTDTFAVDEVKPVWEIREQLCEKYDVQVKPHIHVDAAVGWSLIFFLDYDFDLNPLSINPVTLTGLRRNVERFRQLKYADSFTVDFQKWGYVPYTSSLVMIRNAEDLRSMENDPENFSYFEKDLEGATHLQSTIECSRGAVGVFGAYAAMHFMGVEGYQVMIANCLQNANYFRQRLREFPNVKVVAPENQGPSVGFRIYDPNTVIDANSEFAAEFAYEASEDYQDRVQGNTAFHRDAFKRRGKVGLYSNWVSSITHTDYDHKSRFLFLPGEKVVFMNPLTTRAEIDAYIDELIPE